MARLSDRVLRHGENRLQMRRKGLTFPRIIVLGYAYCGFNGDSLIRENYFLNGAYDCG
jgi:hypothetical protein